VGAIGLLKLGGAAALEGREAQLQLRLDHPNIVRVHNVFFERCFVCILMDMCSGGDLIGAMEAHWEQEGRIHSSEVVHICRQMAVAVEFLHSKDIAHRDIKGDNFLLDRPDLADPACHVALGDFGTACEVKSGSRLTSRAGTRNHWAPEVFRGDYCSKVDIWALGIVVFALLEGKFPFADEPQIMSLAPELGEEMPDDAASFVLGLLRKAEQERYSAGEAVRHSWLSQTPRPASAIAPTKEAAAEGRCGRLRERGPHFSVDERRQATIVLSVVALVAPCVLVCIVWCLCRMRQDRPEGQNRIENYLV